MFSLLFNNLLSHRHAFENLDDSRLVSYTAHRFYLLTRWTRHASATAEAAASGWIGTTRAKLKPNAVQH